MLQPDDTNSNSKLNKLRASVLGANDGIVSTSAVLMGVAGASGDTGLLFIAGLAALVAGALSMAVGEYVSVSSQSDTEAAFIEKERKLLEQKPKEQLIVLARAYADMGMRKTTALQVAKELSMKDPLKAHLQIRHSINEEDLSSPTQAAIASFIAFAAGGIVPFIIAIISPAAIREITIVLSVVLALSITGYLSAKAGNAPLFRAISRIVLGGIIAMGVTYAVGAIFGTAIG